MKLKSNWEELLKKRFTFSTKQQRICWRKTNGWAKKSKPDYPVDLESFIAWIRLNLTESD